VPQSITPSRVNKPTTNDVNAELLTSANAAGRKPLVVQGIAGQTANLLEAQSSAGAVLTSVGSTGALTSANIIQAALSTTAGGFRHGATGPVWIAGTGSPEGVVTAVVGSIYSRTNGAVGATFYRKESNGTGPTGWSVVPDAGAYVEIAGDNMTGNLGLGQDPPTAKLHFAAATTAAGGILFGTDTNLFRRNVGVLGTDHTFQLGTGNAQVALSPTGKVGIYCAGAPADALLRAGQAGMNNFNATTTVYGVSAEPINNGSGSVVAVLARAGTNTPSSTVASMEAVRASISVTVGTAVTEAAVVRALSPTIVTGSVTNLYGVDIQAMDVTGVTNGYGIYQQGTNDINAFAGNVRCSNGITFPDAVSTKIVWHSGGHTTGIAAGTLYHDVALASVHEFRVNTVNKARISNTALTLASGVVVESPSGFRHGASTTPSWTAGAGTPEGAVTAPVGSLWSRTNGAAGSAVYRKESGTGNTGWAAINDMPLGNWTAYTPVFTTAADSPGMAVGTSGYIMGYYRMIAPYTLAVHIQFQWGTSGGFGGSGTHQLSLPPGYVANNDSQDSWQTIFGVIWRNDNARSSQATAQVRRNDSRLWLHAPETAADGYWGHNYLPVHTDGATPYPTNYYPSGGCRFAGIIHVQQQW
jgi:hypothetical protein